MEMELNYLKIEKIYDTLNKLNENYVYSSDKKILFDNYKKLLTISYDIFKGSAKQKEYMEALKSLPAILVDEEEQSSLKLFLKSLKQITIEIRDNVKSDSSNQQILPLEKSSDSFSNRIFIVHGHDEGMKNAVFRTIERLGLKPIILHEQPDRGRTIIEKFEQYSDVSFAVILLSPDDVCTKSDLPLENAILRARQNVVLELGFFLGKLGRDRVLPLYSKKSNNFDFPSDLDGVLYVPYEKDDGGWKLRLGQELKACGYDVDLNKL